jgi:hypothetical protein
MQEYSYQPLQGDEVRVLEIIELEPVLHFRLLHVDVAQVPPYIALSYTWGPPSFCDSTLIENCTLAITASLKGALDALASDVHAASCCFWIDAICINQQDVAERSSQVRMMQRIYTQSQAIYVWMGPSADNSDSAMRKMKEFGAFVLSFKRSNSDTDAASLTDNSDLEYDYSDAVEQAVSPDNSALYGPPGSDTHQAWDAIGMLLQRDWWSRAWIIQEATCSVATFFYCGESKGNAVTWADVQVTQMIRDTLTETHLCTELAGRVKVDRVLALDLIRETRNGDPVHPAVSLQKLFYRARDTQCTNHRDKVYSVVGMIAQDDRYQICPEYTRSLIGVYLDVVHLAMRTAPRGHLLDFLAFAGDAVSSRPATLAAVAAEPLPSWVPDWRLEDQPIPFYQFYDVDDPESGEVYWADGGVQPAISIHGEDDASSLPRFNVRGIYIDRISHVLRVADDSRSSTIELDWIDEMYDIIDNEAVTEGEDAESLYSTKNDNASEEAKPDEFPELFYFTGERIKTVCRHVLTADADCWNGNSRRGRRLQFHLLGKDPASLSDRKRARKREEFVAMKTASDRRRTFRTERGYIGLGPARADVGDAICVLYGGSVIYVLRENASSNDDVEGKEDRKIEKMQTWTFIGESYVHGLMDGEVAEWLSTNPSNVKEQDFVII